MEEQRRRGGEAVEVMMMEENRMRRGLDVRYAGVGSTTPNQEDGI